MIVCGGKRMASQLSWHHLIVMKNSQYKTNIKEKCKLKNFFFLANLNYLNKLNSFSLWIALSIINSN